MSYNGLATVFDIQRSSMVDGPGIRTTVFFYGCNLRCKWCHNPEGIGLNGACVLKEYEPKKYSAGQLLEIVLEDKPFYANGGGVTCSGGECMLQSDFLKDFLIKCQKNGIHTAVDTAGLVGFSDFEKILDYTDLFLYDIKCITPDLHKEFTGAHNKLILENLDKIVNAGKPVIVRIPLVPGFNCNDGETQKIADFLGKYKLKGIELLPYHTMGIGKYIKLGIKYTPFKEPEKEITQKYRKIFDNLSC